MSHTQPLKTYSSVPWIIAFCALFASLANLVTGIVILCTYQTGGDVALGILTIVFALWGITGSILALVFIIVQNRYNRSRSNFIAQVSHELRTPLTSIRMYADTLKMHRFTSETDELELISHMDDEIKRLETLTEQILDSRPKTKAAVTDTIDLKAAVLKAVQPFLDNEKTCSRLDIDIPETHPHAHADLNDFINAASNLIRNALTHGGSGTVHITLDSNHEESTFTVRDEGPGIDPKMRKKIFEPFLRGENTTDSHIPGFGLGLSIVKDFAKRYNARLDVHNHPQGGAVFSISLKSA